LTLQVRDGDGAHLLADVGFGDSFRLPLHLQPDVEQNGVDGYTYRLSVHPADECWLLRRRVETDWEAQCRFSLRPHLMADFAERYHFQQTSPGSHFT
jgi:N-hydroxyarylamine O-acetyltransferase